VKIGFWNVAGIENKDENFWRGIEEWDIVIFLETWVEEKGWEKVKGKLPKGYNGKYKWRKKKQEGKSDRRDDDGSKEGD